MKRIFQKIQSNKVLFKNFTSLSILQISNYIFPIITLPYLVRVLGPGKYGLVNFAVAFIAYFNLISDYGFSLSGTKEISILRNNKEKLSKIFSTIITIKLLLSIVSFLIFIAMVYFIPFFKNNWEVYVLSYGFVIGGVLFPSWFYQGIEQMKYITIIQVLIRSIITVLIFILIKEENDYLLLVLLYSITQVMIGISGLLVARFKFQIRLKIPTLDALKVRIKSGWNIFQSTIAINIYTTSNTFILGLFASETVVGYFAAADKIRLAFQGILSVFTQSVFPFVNNLLKISYDKFNFFIKTLLQIQPLIGFIISLILFSFSFQLTDLLLGQEFVVSGKFLKIIAWIPFFVSLSHIFGIQTMLPLGHEKAFNKIYSLAAVNHIIFLFVLVPKYFAFGTSISYLLTEFVVMLLTFLFVFKKHLLTFTVDRN